DHGAAGCDEGAPEAQCVLDPDRVGAALSPQQVEAAPVQPEVVHRRLPCGDALRDALPGRPGLQLVEERSQDVDGGDLRVGLVGQDERLAAGSTPQVQNRAHPCGIRERVERAPCTRITARTLSAGCAMEVDEVVGDLHGLLSLLAVAAARWTCRARVRRPATARVPRRAATPVAGSRPAPHLPGPGRAPRAAPWWPAGPAARPRGSRRSRVPPRWPR